ncbi:hypothetical protein M409DRAFT_27293 [Zasmidium cellare ATCC 36951]|uniref:Uncharacterized protein n=1 Tax=Zasmidium cellare ATCC 36951 TaxID=1080233 RepID=A0A6A6C9F5_ZASCE|nr:uncharacterized protein M409DRAFT_27293 [Zasmidium cellare ATCC 36951]KAF2162289.1 hypothetical protein M409DRAFT_27293 [Zasmidium cellare ATCC 36951]
MSSKNSIVPPHRKQTGTKQTQPKQPQPKSSSPTTKRPTPSLSPFQCGDPSHSTYRPSPELESRIRHNCPLPKTETKILDAKNRTITTITHRATVTDAMVEDYHEEAVARYSKTGGKQGKPICLEEKKKAVDQALVDRQELQDEDWEVVDSADVDDRWDVRGAFSGKRVKALEEGIQ